MDHPIYSYHEMFSFNILDFSLPYKQNLYHKIAKMLRCCNKWLSLNGKLRWNISLQLFETHKIETINKISLNQKMTWFWKAIFNLLQSCFAVSINYQPYITWNTRMIHIYVNSYTFEYKCDQPKMIIFILVYLVYLNLYIFVCFNSYKYFGGNRSGVSAKPQNLQWTKYNHILCRIKV